MTQAADDLIEELSTEQVETEPVSRSEEVIEESRETDHEAQTEGRKSVRSKKVVERYRAPSPVKRKSTTKTVGSGVALGDVSATVERIGKLDSDHDALKRLHAIMYGSVGQQTTRKKMIRAWTGTDDEDRVKEMSRMIELTKGLSLAKEICQVLGLSTSKDREGLNAVLLEYLTTPTASVSSQTAKKRVKKSKKKSPKVKRQRVSGKTPFECFLERREAELKAAGGLTAAEITALLAREWKNMSEEEKRVDDEESSSDSSSSSEDDGTSSDGSSPREPEGEM